MKERDLITSVMGDMKEYYKNKPFWYYKIPDYPVSRFGGSGYAGGKRFVDVVACINGIPVAIEFKLHKTLGSFPFSKVPDEQVDALLDFERAGGVALLAIGQVVKVSDYSEKQTEKDNILLSKEVRRGILYRLFVATPAEWKFQEDIVKAKSIRLSDTKFTRYVKNDGKWDMLMFNHDLYLYKNANYIP